VQRLHAAAGTQVEHRGDGVSHRRRRERERGPADAGDVVALLSAGVEVREHPPLTPGVIAVGAQVHGGGPACALTAQQTGPHGIRRRERGQRGGDGGVRLDRPEQQQPHQHAQLAALGAGPVRGLRLTAPERGVCLAPEQRPHPVEPVAGAAQGSA
jgi:hypothetical protein